LCLSNIYILLDAPPRASLTPHPGQESKRCQHRKRFWPPLAAELELWRDDVKFLPWWVKGTGIESAVPGIIASAHVRPGNSVLWIVNTNREDKTASVHIDAQKIGLDPGVAIQAYDAEDGKRYPVTGGVLTVPVPKRMWRAVRLSQPRLVGQKLAFVADFEQEVAATEAWGGRYPLGASLPVPVDGGKSGKGALIETPLSFSARHHVSGVEGAISLDVRLKDSGDGSLITVAGLTLGVNKGVLTLQGSGLAAAVSNVRTFVNDQKWHAVTLAWLGNEVWVSCDGSEVLTARLNAPLRLPGMGHGLEIRDEGVGIEPAQEVFGPIHAIIDNLRMGKPPPRINPAKTSFQESRSAASPTQSLGESFR